MIIRLLIFIACFFCPVSVHAAAPDSLELGPLSAKNLQKIYQYYHYDGVKGYLRLPDYTYPPIYLTSFPSGFSEIADEKQRNAMFIKILAPLAFKINNEILLERSEIQKIAAAFEQEQELNESQTRLLENKAQKYDIFSRLKGYQRNKYLISELLVKVDSLPPSFLIAAAAMETNWGLSRIVKEGNSLYKQLVWHTDQGLKPEGETEDDSYRIAVFPNLAASMRAFALKLNSHIAFEHLRNYRRELRYQRSTLTGSTFVHTMLWNSPLKNYAGIIEYTIAYYELNIIDKSRLDSNIISKPLPAELKKFQLKASPDSM